MKKNYFLSFLTFIFSVSLSLADTEPQQIDCYDEKSKTYFGYAQEEESGFYLYQYSKDQPYTKVNSQPYDILKDLEKENDLDCSEQDEEGDKNRAGGSN